MVKLPEKLAPEQAAPLLCAGVTAYSPLKQFRDSTKVYRGGILGLGGVGHLGVLIAKAMGHHVTVISSSDKKKVEALEHLGADAFLVSSDGAEMKKAANSLDYILDTVPAFHDLQTYLSLLKVDGKVIIVGVATKPLEFDSDDIILGRQCYFWFWANLTHALDIDAEILCCYAGKKTITGSFVGNMEDTQGVLDFWAEKGLSSMIEVVKADYANEAFERMVKNDVRYRFVLDMAGSNL